MFFKIHNFVTVTKICILSIWNLFPFFFYLRGFHSNSLNSTLIYVYKNGRIVSFCCFIFTESFSSTVVFVGSVLGGVLFLAICAFVFLSYKYLLGFSAFYIQKLTYHLIKFSNANGIIPQKNLNIYFNTTIHNPYLK